VQNAVNASVANPFYNALPANKMPGQLRTQQNVAVSQLLRPYPQYTALTQALINGRGDHYQAFQLSVQRSFSNGFNVVLGYNFNHETSQEFYDNVDTFTRTFSWIPAQNARHRLTGASIYELPFGRGRHFMHSGSPLLEEAARSCRKRCVYYLPGAYNCAWAQSGRWRPGSQSTSDFSFNPMAIIMPAFTRRTNPVRRRPARIRCIWTDLAKMFPIKERVKFELRAEHSAPDVSGDNPVLSPTAPPSARSSAEAGETGRRCNTGPRHLLVLCFRRLQYRRRLRGYAGSTACQVAIPPKPPPIHHGPRRLALETGQPGEWAFGAGLQAITFVSRVDAGHYLELEQSWYAKLDRYARTPGHVRPGGVRHRIFDPEAAILRCFACHSTGPVSLADDGAIVPAEPGVKCEDCHGPAAAHVRDSARARPIHPGRLDGAAMGNLPGACHRAPSATTAPDLRDPWNARHQPLLLAASRCFRASQGKLTCLTCHAPHAPLETRLAAYDTACAGCHAAPRHRTAVKGIACAGCHMPAVKPAEGLSFATHRIAVYVPLP
jgi:hypothetical protein